MPVGYAPTAGSVNAPRPKVNVIGTVEHATVAEEEKESLLFPSRANSAVSTISVLDREKQQRQARDFEGVGDCSRCMGDWFTPGRAVCCLTMVCALNYLDRGIVSGAAMEITGCVSSFDECTLRDDQTEAQLRNCTLECKACGPCDVKQTGFGISMAQLGFLQSSFMVGYSISSIIYSQLVQRIRPFKLISVALVLWIVAVVLSGLSGFWCDDGPGGLTDGLCGSFYLAVFARALSGVGEAATATIAAVYLDDAVPPQKKGLMFGIYYSAIPLGTAVGFIYAGQIANAYRWEWAFLGEAPPMVLFAIGAWFIPFRLKSSQSRSRNNSTGLAPRHSSLDALTAGLLPDSKNVPAINEDNGSDSGNNNAGDALSLDQPFLLEPKVEQSLLTELCVCVISPIYMMTAFGYAAYTAVIAGFSYYGPTYIRKRTSWGYAETEADTVFGGIVAVTGLVGTALGGIMLDRCSGKANGPQRLVPALGTVLLEVVIGTAICFGAGYCETAEAFFVCLAFGVLFMFMTTAGVNVALMWSVPPANRATAMALSVIIIHLFGDVPSPIVIGEIDRATSPQTTFLLTSSWLFWAIFFWGAAWLLALLRVKREKSASEEELQPSANAAEAECRASAAADRLAWSPYQRYGFSDPEEEDETEDEASSPTAMFENGDVSSSWRADRL